MTNNYSILLEIAPEQSSVQIFTFFLIGRSFIQALYCHVHHPRLPVC